MSNLIGMESMLHISFSLAAFVFSVVLYVLILALGSGQQHKNLKFRTLVIIIVIGNLISMLDNIFRDSGMFPTPIAIKLLLLLLVYLFNILLTYYVALYMETFFGEFKYKQLFFRINTSVVIAGVILTVGVYIRQFILYDGDNVLTSFPLIMRIILGYVFELYYLLYSVALFIIFQKTLSSRARVTSKAAFTVVIGSILFELLNTIGLGSGILYNYFGVVLGLYIFYIGVETPDYRNLLKTLTDLDAARLTADKANRSKSDFLANMSHEIRTPINAILGMNEMILRESGDDAIITYSENIQNAGKTLLGLINDILDFSKIEAGKIEIIPVEYDLSLCINDLISLISSRAERKGLQLRLEIDRRIPRYLYGDEMRVKQVITNILTNAVKYTEKGYISFSIGYEIAGEGNCILLNVAIHDTGIGIKKEDIPKLFSEFERLEEKRNRSIEGTGLGMNITKRLLELMGSSLKVDSTYGIGSTFSFSLKQEVKSWDELGDYEASYLEHRHKEYRELFTAPEAVVLVVDDNPMNLLVFKSLVKKTLIRTVTADSGAEALNLAKSEKFDVIFLDHMMPGMDGIETFRELKKINGPNKETPAVCLTANAISGAKEQYERAGFEGYLTKPIDSQKLEDTLLKYIPSEKVLLSTARAEDTPEKDVLPPDLSLLVNSSIDPRKGLKNAGDADSYRTLLKTFYDLMEERMKELDHYLASGNTDDYTVLVHSIKSSSRIIGAEELGNSAQELEDAGKAGDLAFIETNHPFFKNSLLSTKAPLSAVFDMAVKETEEMPVAGTDYLKEVYKEIKSAAGDYDTNRLDSLFEELSEYSLPEDEKELWDKLKKAYEEFDYQELILLSETGLRK